MRESNPYLFFLSIFVVGFACLPGVSASADISPQQESRQKADEVAALIKQNEQQLTAEQAAQVSTLLGRALTVVRQPGVSSSWNGCYQEMAARLDEASMARLCGGQGSSETAACFLSANVRMDKESAIRLCARGGTAETAACFQDAFVRLSQEQAIALCSPRGTREAVECFREASVRLNPDQALRLCSHGATSAAVDCFRDAATRLPAAEAVTICARKPVL